jgi:tetratricopeptide (TPR) repeat protein
MFFVQIFIQIFAIIFYHFLGIFIMRTFLTTLVVMLFASTFASTFTSTLAFAQTDETALLKAKQTVQAAAISGDATMLKAARELAQASVTQTTEPSKKAAALYFVGYANYSLVNLPSEKESKEQNTDAGIVALEEAVKLEPAFADAHALLGSLYGQKAGGGMMAGMKYGQKSAVTMERAITLQPKNPRILMLEGVSLFFKPAMWGGDKQKALTNLQRACELAEQGACAAKEATMPDWGHADVFAWKGVMFAKSDEADTDNAKAAYERALQLQPNYNWVKYVLLPKLSAK